MQVFIVGSPMETVVAMTGDTHRYNKQVVEIGQIIDALNGKKAWSRHPAVLQYRGYVRWLQYYELCLIAYSVNDLDGVEEFDALALQITPPFHTEEYFDQMKRRLYTKNPEHYKQWEHLGRSDENWYWSQEENRFIKYVNGKRVE